jgi:hypothetical protein
MGAVTGPVFKHSKHDGIAFLAFYMQTDRSSEPHGTRALDSDLHRSGHLGGGGRGKGEMEGPAPLKKVLRLQSPASSQSSHSHFPAFLLLFCSPSPVPPDLRLALFSDNDSNTGSRFSDRLCSENPTGVPLAFPA